MRLRQAYSLFAVGLLLIAASCRSVRKEYAVTVAIESSKSDSFYYYVLQNNSPKDIFILDDYDVVVAGDSVIFEPFYTPHSGQPLTFWPNQFIPPALVCLNPGTHFAGKIFAGMSNEKGLKTKQFFMRIYNESYSGYLSDWSVGYITDFLGYQNECSRLIEASVN